MLKFFLDLFFPRSCYYCKREGRYLCSNCILSYLYINWEVRCYICGKPSSIGFVHKECSDQGYLDGLVYFTLYDQKVKEIISDVKYNYYYDILFEIGDMMGEYLKLFKLDGDIVLCDVPLHKHKLRVRGFNQSEILAKQIAKNRSLRFSNLLIRKVDTITQVGLTREERENNLREAFISSKKIPENVLIVDDVFTSGSTLNQCARVLKQSGAKRVYGFVFAKSRE